MVTAAGPRRSGDELQHLVDDLADQLGRSVVVNDPLIRLMYTSRHFGDEDGLRVRAVLQRDAGAEASHYFLAHGVARWNAPGMVPGSTELQMLPRLCVPLRERAELLGLLMVIDADGSLTAGEVRRIQQVAEGIAALLHHDRLDAGDEQARREQALVRLLGDDAGSRRAALRQSLAGRWIDDHEHAVVTVLEVADSELPPAQVELAMRTVLDSAFRRHAHRALYTVRDDRAVVLQTAHRLDRAELVDSARRTATGLEQLLDRRGSVLVGIGGAAEELKRAWISYSQALTAVRGARLLPLLDRIGRWDELGSYAVLLQLPDDALTPALVPGALRALLEHDKAPRLVRTLRAFLDHGGSIPRTAAELHLHRTSLYYRLAQIHEITGMDLDDGDHRLQLHIGLRVADLVPGG